MKVGKNWRKKRKKEETVERRATGRWCDRPQPEFDTRLRYSRGSI
jgi:hypothetical protein